MKRMDQYLEEAKKDNNMKIPSYLDPNCIMTTTLDNFNSLDDILQNNDPAIRILFTCKVSILYVVEKQWFTSKKWRQSNNRRK